MFVLFAGGGNSEWFTTTIDESMFDQVFAYLTRRMRFDGPTRTFHHTMTKYTTVEFFYDDGFVATGYESPRSKAAW